MISESQTTPADHRLGDPVIVFAGGGSGGHLSPGLAIAERLIEQRQACGCVFFCSRREIDRTMLDEAGHEREPITASGFHPRPDRLWRFLRDGHRGRDEAAAALIAHGADLVVALGGYAAAPTVAAAHKQRIPVILINLDDPPGKANRWMARKCDHVYSAVPVTSPRRFAKEVVGLPIRKRAIAPADPATCRDRLGLDPDRLTMLITGASQGATSINELAKALAAGEAEALAGWQILHLCGRDDPAPIRAAYEAAGIPAVVEPFLHDMGLAWGGADLAVSRAGANSVAEIAANAVPAFFLPYPWHRDQHQERNAAPLVEAGGAVIGDDHIHAAANLRAHRDTLRELLLNSSQRDAMRSALRQLPHTDAAPRIAAIILEMTAAT